MGNALQDHLEAVTYAKLPYPKEALAALANIDRIFNTPNPIGLPGQLRALL